MEAPDNRNLRRHQRVRLGGGALLIVDPRLGMVGAKGHLIDLSEGGCQLRVQCRLDAHLAGRVRLELAGKVLWFPVITRWVRRDSEGWTVGCAFDRVTTEKQETLKAALFELSLTRPGLTEALIERNTTAGLTGSPRRVDRPTR
ncbi:MAG: PilZ domain-containing protein [Acidimicrobiia bacterium]